MNRGCQHAYQLFKQCKEVACCGWVALLYCCICHTPQDCRSNLYCPCCWTTLLHCCICHVSQDCKSHLYCPCCWLLLSAGAAAFVQMVVLSQVSGAILFLVLAAWLVDICCCKSERQGGAVPARRSVRVWVLGLGINAVGAQPGQWCSRVPVISCVVLRAVVASL